MKKFSTPNIRNVVLVGHGGTGKTSLNEAMLFTLGAITRLGKIEDGSTVSDYDPDEIKRKISINVSLSYGEYKNCKINMIDTPGYADFIGEVISSLRVAENALLVIDAVSGVEVQAEKAWGYASDYGLSPLVFVNKMDKENADFFEALTGAVESFGNSVIPVQLPVGKESTFQGVIDLIKMKACFTKGGKVIEEDIPADLLAQAEEYREKLIEKIAESDDRLLEKYLEGEELKPEELISGLRVGIKSKNLVPVLCGSATKNAGIQSLMEVIVDYLPSPADEKEIKGISSQTNEEITRTPDENDTFSAFVFKTMTDPYVGRLNYVRVYSGNLKADSVVYNAVKRKKEKIGHIFYLRGKIQEETKEVPAGDIAVIPKLAETETNDALCDEAKPIVFESVKFPEPLISVAVEPKTKGDEEKISTSLAKLAEEDVTLKVYRNPETKQTVVSGIGDVHLEVLMDRLKRKFGVETQLSAPKIPFRETIRRSAKAQGKYKKQTGGRGQYGDCWLEIEPMEKGKGFEFVDKIFGGAIPKGFIPAVEKGVREAIEAGVVAGYPVVDVRVKVYDGSYHPVDSSEMAFKIAGSMAFKSAMAQADPIILEPIMNVEVVVPEMYMGDVIGDLSGKRGKILGMEARGKNQVVKALAPLAEMSRYATELRSITHGRGSYSLEFTSYEEVPADISKKIIEESKKEKE